MREYNYTRATSSSTSSSSSSSCFGTSAGLEVIRDFLGCIAGILFNSLSRGSASLLQLGALHDRSKRKRRFMSPTFLKQASSSSSEWENDCDEGMKTSGKRLSQQRSWKMTASSWTSEIDHDREWEIRKDVLARSTSSVSASAASAASAAAAVVNKKKKQIVGRCVSDCTGMRNKSKETCSEREVVRTRSLTDADLDELRGCIDLGFGFKNEADPELWETLPALELCYAISQQFKEVHGESPATSFIGPDGSSETSSEDTGSLVASPSSWQIASPGDQQVKTRLRHWARAVACTVVQSL